MSGTNTVRTCTIPIFNIQYEIIPFFLYFTQALSTSSSFNHHQNIKTFYHFNTSEHILVHRTWGTYISIIILLSFNLSGELDEQSKLYK